jgi:radical SAM protein with 4Fe4S-binding SPASM domain
MLTDLAKLTQLGMWRERCKREKATHPLTYLFWETTLRCNLACRHCGSVCGPAAGGDELSTDEIERVFSEIATDFDPSRIVLAVTGGEPLVRPDLFEVLRHATGLGFHWGLVTNGLLVDEPMVARLAEARMGTVSVSLDGLGATHDYLRGGRPGLFERVVESVRLMVAAKAFQVVQVTTCVSDYNLSQLEDLYQLVGEVGVDEWRLLLVSRIGRAKDDPRFFLNGAQLKQVLDFIVVKRHQPGRPRVLFEEEGFLGLAYEGEVRDNLFFCPAGVNVGSVLADGAISACPSLPRQFVQGNVRQERFRDVWENRFEQFRDRRWKKCGICRTCEWWRFCEGNGLHLWDFGRSQPSVCELKLLNGENDGLR